MDRHRGGLLALFIEQTQGLAQPDVGSFCFHPLHSQELSFACWRKLLTELSNLACRTGCTPIHRRVEDGRGGLGHAATLRFPSPLIKPDVRICRVAQPLLAFAPTDPIVRRYRNGLFRTDLRRVNHPCHA